MLKWSRRLDKRERHPTNIEMIEKEKECQN